MRFFFNQLSSRINGIHVESLIIVFINDSIENSIILMSLTWISRDNYNPDKPSANRIFVNPFIIFRVYKTNMLIALACAIFFLNGCN